jgi:hypothetical protein
MRLYQNMKIKFSSFILAVLASLVFTGSSFAQKAVDNNKPMVKSKQSLTNAPSNVQGHSTILQSHIKSLGTVGRTQRYEIVQVKVRGLDTPNLAGFFVYDSTTDEIVGVQTAGAPGLGVAIVNGGSYVAGNYLFGSKLRPNNQNINSGNEGGGTTVNATGGTANGNGGSATATGNGGAGGSASNSGGTGTGTTVNVNSGAANGNGTINLGRP